MSSHAGLSSALDSLGHTLQRIDKQELHELYNALQDALKSNDSTKIEELAKVISKKHHELGAAAYEVDKAFKDSHHHLTPEDKKFIEHARDLYHSLGAN